MATGIAESEVVMGDMVDMAGVADLAVGVAGVADLAVAGVTGLAIEEAELTVGVALL